MPGTHRYRTITTFSVPYAYIHTRRLAQQSEDMKMQKYITEKALLSRLNRKLALEGKTIKVCRSDSKWFGSLGRFYCVDVRANAVEAMDIDVAQWSRDWWYCKSL